MTFPHPDIIVPPTATALEAMRAIDTGGLEVALVCDAQRRLLAVITDGDLRRAILAGKPLTTLVSAIGNARFTSLSPEATRADAVRLMLVRNFKREGLPLARLFQSENSQTESQLLAKLVH